MPRSEGWGHCWADAFLSGPLGQGTWLSAHDPGWPEFRVPGERLRGSGGAVLVMGSEALLWGPGAGPAHQMALFTRERWPPERKALKSSQLAWLSAPWVVLLEDNSTSPVGLARSSRRLVDSDLPPWSLSLGLKAGRQGPGWVGAKVIGGSCLAALSPAQDCPQLPVQGPTCTHSVSPRP